jgi:hypothetical protein
MLRYTILIIFSLALSNVFGQYSARLMVFSGASVPFFFNTLDRLENGLNTEAFPTILGITLIDQDVTSDPEITGFVLSARAATPEIVGYSNSIPLSLITIEIDPSIGVFDGGTFTFIQNVPTELSFGSVDLLTFLRTTPTFTPLNQNIDRAQVVFRCGEGGGGLIGVPGDRYAVDIIFELTPTGFGF